MAKRSSDTAAVVGAFGGDRPVLRSYESKSTRKISNGYVTSTCSEGRNGYESHETFHSSPEPIGAPHGPSEDRSSLRDAAEYLKGNK